jgi:hypothetical protein
MQERDELRGLKREINMSRERKVQKKYICVWKRKKKQRMKEKRRKREKDEWHERYEVDESSER